MDHQFNSLGPSDATWWQRTESILAQVMACCLTAPSHYLNQCQLIISTFLCHPSEGITLRKSEETNQLNKIENYIFKIASISPRGQWVINSLPPSDAIWQQILANKGSDNSLLPYGTKPLPEPMLTSNHWHPFQYNIKEKTQDNDITAHIKNQIYIQYIYS